MMAALPLRALLVLALVHGALAAPLPVAKNTLDEQPTCPELIDEKYGCDASLRRCGTCVTRAWPRLRNEPACAGLGHGALLQHCEPIRKDSSNDESDDDDNTLSGLFKSTWAASDPVNTTLPGGQGGRDLYNAFANKASLRIGRLP